MHGRLAANVTLLQAVARGAGELPADVRVGVCVPSLYLAQAQSLLEGSPVAWGVQDVSAFTHGAYTGEVAAPMVTDFGATLAIIGHSERRAYHRESAELVAVKTQRALEAGLTPIVCVGETLEEREAGLTEQVVGTQLDEVLAKLSVQEASRLVVAYEPVWAIGTGKTATPEIAQEAHAFIKSLLDAPVLYGGSVKPENAAELLAQPAVDGALVGGASLDVESFTAICAAAARIPS